MDHDHSLGDEPATALTGIMELTVGKPQLCVEGHIDATMLSLDLKRSDLSNGLQATLIRQSVSLRLSSHNLYYVKLW